MGRAGYWRLLLDVDDLRSMGRAYRTAAAMNRTRSASGCSSTRGRWTQLARERQALEAQAEGDRAAAGRAPSRARRAIERAVAARTALVESIDARRDLNAQLTGELEAAQQRLQTADRAARRPGARGGQRCRSGRSAAR